MSVYSNQIDHEVRIVHSIMDDLAMDGVDFESFALGSDDYRRFYSHCKQVEPRLTVMAVNKGFRTYVERELASAKAKPRTISGVQLPISEAHIISYDHGRGGYEVILFHNGQRVSSHSFPARNSTTKEVQIAKQRASDFAITVSAN